MVQMAFVGTQYQEQMQANPSGLQGVEVTWNGGSVDELVATGNRPQVVVVDLERLGERPLRAIERMQEELGPEVLLVIYRYAKRETIHGIQSENVRVIQGPVSLAALRSQILSLVVREMFAQTNDRGAGSPPQGDVSSDLASCPRCGSRVPKRRLETV